MTRHLAVVRDYRPRELPGTWPDAEDRAVQWSNWQPNIVMFICPPPPPYACTQCGSTAIPDRSEGRIIPKAGTRSSFRRPYRSKRQPGMFWQRLKKVAAWPVVRLLATRCPDCLAAEIYDTDTDIVHIPPWDDPSEVA